MRYLAWAFILSSPFIALAQNYHITPHAIPAVTHHANVLAAQAAIVLFHAVQSFLV